MTTQRILRRIQIQEMTGLSLATIYRLIKTGDFPQPIQLSQQAVGWDRTDIEAWIDARKATKH